MARLQGNVICQCGICFWAAQQFTPKASRAKSLQALPRPTRLPAMARVRVRITSELYFEPADVTVAPGTTVVWGVDEDMMRCLEHTVLVRRLSFLLGTQAKRKHSVKGASTAQRADGGDGAALLQCPSVCVCVCVCGWVRQTGLRSVDCGVLSWDLICVVSTGRSSRSCCVHLCFCTCDASLVLCASV